MPKGSRYVLRKVPGHPWASNKGYVHEHVLAVEKAMGKPLRPGAVVHHINGDGKDNRPANLVVCNSNSHHALIHARARVVRAGGHPSVDKICCRCGEILLKENFYRSQARWDGLEPVCRECSRERQSEYYRRRKAA